MEVESVSDTAIPFYLSNVRVDKPTSGGDPPMGLVTSPRIDEVIVA
jgi:hypothetical protein